MRLAPCISDAYVPSARLSVISHPRRTGHDRFEFNCLDCRVFVNNLDARNVFVFITTFRLTQIKKHYGVTRLCEIVTLKTSTLFAKTQCVVGKHILV